MGPEGIVVVGVRVDKPTALTASELNVVLSIHLHHLISVVDHELTELIGVVEAIVVSDTAVKFAVGTVISHMTSI